MRMRFTRRVVQIVALVGFIALVTMTKWDPGGRPPVQPWYLRIDPLVALSAALAPLHHVLPYFLPAIVLLALTILFGRFFCGWLCPLGTTIDTCETLFWRKRRRVVEHVNRPAMKYYVLAVAALAAVFGTQLAWIVDPIPLLTRATAQGAVPVVQKAFNWLLVVGSPLLHRFHIHIYPGEVHTFQLNLLAVAMLAVAVGLSYLSRRYWCRTICPLGALLGLVSRWGVWRRWVTGCLTCHRCVSDCKMGAIPMDQPSRTKAAECILCYDCISCPKEHIVHVGLHNPYALRPQSGRQERQEHLTELGTSRRKFLAAAGVGVLYGAVASTGVSRQVLNDGLIRPPGAIIRQPNGSFVRMSEDDLRATCVRCGNCMKACPTGVIQPAVGEGGLDCLYTPLMVPRLGWCEQTCTVCGEICPSGALSPFTKDEKYSIQIGRAWIDESKCLAWRNADLWKLCLVCYEHCPYGSIELLISADGRKRPAVNEDKCVGCGQCENRCPITPQRAIMVQRKTWTGSRRAPSKAELRRRQQEVENRPYTGAGD